MRYFLLCLSSLLWQSWYNKENHTILNQIHDILTELHNKEREIAPGKVPAYMGIKGNEEIDKATKQQQILYVRDNHKTTSYRLQTDYQEG